MEPQHSAVHYQTLTPIDKDGGFVMDFSIDVMEDIPAEVENVMHLATVGLFREAREAAASTMERYLDKFPILIEFLRLLYDQGDYLSLRDHVQTAIEYKKKWDDEQILLLSLFEDLTLVHLQGYSHHVFQRLESRNLVVQNFNSTALGAMSEEQSLAISLMIRLKYLRYQYQGAITATNFVLWSTKKTDNAPYAFFEHMLQQENYWAAVNALEVCLRKAKKHFHTLNFTRLWEAIEPLATRCSANDPEEVLWATTNLLQTFCEGLLRRTATQIKSWGSAIAFLSNMPQIIEAKCEPKYAWSNSRSFRRQKLIELDKAVLTRNQSRDLEIDEATARHLSRVSDHAQEHQDIHLMDGIRWRIDVLIQGVDPTKIPTPAGNIPVEIYEKRHKLMLQANKTSKDEWFRSSLGVLSPLAVVHRGLPRVEILDAASAIPAAGDQFVSDDSGQSWEEKQFQKALPSLCSIAVLICLGGTMHHFTPGEQDLSESEHTLSSVSSLYGPGNIVAWYLSGISLLYDINASPEAFSSKANGFLETLKKLAIWSRFLFLVGLGTWAVSESLFRGLKQDFGPSYATAVYMSDKAFELTTLYWFVKMYPIRFKARRGPYSGDLPTKPKRAHRYTLVPYVVLVLAWIASRSLANGHKVFNIDRRNSPELPMKWRPLAPAWTKPLIVLGCFLSSWAFGKWLQPKKLSFAWPAGVLASFFMIHSGLYGTLGAFRLTTASILDLDQIFQIVTVVLALVVQYGSEVVEYAVERHGSSSQNSPMTATQYSQRLEGPMEWNSVTPWVRSRVEEKSHSNSIKWSGVE